jgi:uncharacterized damage-inducible protein DinB
MGTTAGPRDERIAHLRRLFEFEAWANREALASLAPTTGTEPPARTVQVLAHVLGAGRLWLERLNGARPAVRVWPDSSVEDLRAELEDLARRWEDYLDDLAPADLSREIAYVNSKGEPWKTTVADVLDHVLLHSSYHRGQIASHLRAAGLEPAYTDFVHAARQGFLD